MYLLLSFVDQPHGHRLHPARRKITGDFFPQQGAEHVPDDAIQESPRLLSLHPVHIDQARALECSLDRLLCDLGKHDALEFPSGDAQDFLEVPGNRLSFSIQVGRQIDEIRLFCSFPQFLKHLLFAWQYLVLRNPAVLRIHSHSPHERFSRLGLSKPLLFGRREFLVTLFELPRSPAALAARGQISYMPDARFDNVSSAQILVNSPGFGRRFDND